MKRAALYARVSTDKQAKQATIQSQLFDLKKQIAQAGQVLVKEYIDDVYRGALLDRPALDELRKDTKGDVYDIIYFHSADRLARKVAHQTIIVDELLRCAKQIVIGGKDFVRNPENSLTLTMLGAFAEYEREKIVERTTRGWRHRIRTGGLVSQGNCTYGFNYVPKTATSPCAIVINEQEADIVRWIFEAYANGTGMSSITRMLEERGIPTKRGKTLWRKDKILYMLKNHVYAGIRYFNSMTREAEPKKGRKHARMIYRDRSEWVGVAVPAIVSQELFDRVQAGLQKIREKYRHPVTHHLLRGLVECGECGAGCSSYRRYVGKKLTIGKRRIYHKAAYKCNFRSRQNMHAQKNITPCRNSEVVTHVLEDAVFNIIGEHMFDPVKLRECMDAFKSDARPDHVKIEHGLIKLARQIQTIGERKKQLIDLYASGILSEEAYVDGNIELDKELHEVKRKKAEYVREIPLLHKESVDLSIRHFCDMARAKFERCASFENKQQFLAEHVERVIYERYRVTVTGSVPIKTQISETQEIETRKLEFCLRGEIDTTMLHRRPRKTFAEDGRLKAFGGGKPSFVPPPLCASSNATSAHASTT